MFGSTTMKAENEKKVKSKDPFSRKRAKMQNSDHRDFRLGIHIHACTCTHYCI